MFLETCSADYQRSCVTVHSMSWPTTDDPRTEFVTVRLTQSEAADLDQHAQSRGFRSRSAAVRDAVDRVIAAEKKREKKLKGRNKPVVAPEDGV